MIFFKKFKIKLLKIKALHSRFFSGIIFFLYFIRTVSLKFLFRKQLDFQTSFTKLAALITFIELFRLISNKTLADTVCGSCKTKMRNIIHKNSNLQEEKYAIIHN